MKKLVLILVLFAGLNGSGQLINYDSIANKTALKTDSLLFNQIIEEVDKNTSELTAPVNDYLWLYLNGYINGSLNYKDKAKIDWSQLQNELRANSRSINSYRRFKQSLDISIGVDSLYSALQPDIETMNLCNDLMILKNELNKVKGNLSPASSTWVGDDPTLLLLNLNRSIRKFNKNYAGKEIKGMKIPELKTYKLVLVEE